MSEKHDVVKLRQKRETALHLTEAIDAAVALAREHGHSSVSVMLGMARDLARADQTEAEQALMQSGGYDPLVCGDAGDARTEGHYAPPSEATGIRNVSRTPRHFFERWTRPATRAVASGLLTSLAFHRGQSGGTRPLGRE